MTPRATSNSCGCSQAAPESEVCAPSRSSEMGSIIRAYKNSVIPDIGPLAIDEHTDDVYDEVETAPGVILKFPSAVSIEARGVSKQSSSVYDHSRNPSIVSNANP